jgi:hypothetical protein
MSAPTLHRPTYEEAGDMGCLGVEYSRGSTGGSRGRSRRDVAEPFGIKHLGSSRVLGRLRRASAERWGRADLRFGCK